MAQNGVWARTAPTRQRLMMVMTIVAVVTALRERAFARNRARFGGEPR